MPAILPSGRRAVMPDTNTRLPLRRNRDPLGEVTARLGEAAGANLLPRHGPRLQAERRSHAKTARRGAVAVSCVASAQSYPSKPVRIIVPFPPGGTTDLVARIVQPKFQELMGQPVLIENRSGAGGSVGAAEVARAPADGYTLLMVFDTHAVNHHIFKMAPDPFKQLEHISLMVRSPSAFVEVTSFAPNNLREMVAYAKASPEKVTYATPGSGSSNHLAALLLEQVAGVKMTHRLQGRRADDPGAAQPAGACLVLLAAAHGAAHQGRQGQAPRGRQPRARAAAARRAGSGGDLSRLRAVLPGSASCRPPAFAKEVVTKVHREMVRTLQAPDVGGKLTEQGFEVVASSPRSSSASCRASRTSWAG